MKENIFEAPEYYHKLGWKSIQVLASQENYDIEIPRIEID